MKANEISMYNNFARFDHSFFSSVFCIFFLLIFPFLLCYTGNILYYTLYVIRDAIPCFVLFYFSLVLALVFGLCDSVAWLSKWMNEWVIVIETLRLSDVWCLIIEVWNWGYVELGIWGVKCWSWARRERYVKCIMWG